VFVFFFFTQKASGLLHLEFEPYIIVVLQLHLQSVYVMKKSG